MKKGDLVQRVRFPDDSLIASPALGPSQQLKSKWALPCVVVRGPYEMGYKTGGNDKSAKLVVTKAIDVLYDGEVRVACRLSDFMRITR